MAVKTQESDGKRKPMTARELAKMYHREETVAVIDVFENKKANGVTPLHTTAQCVAQDGTEMAVAVRMYAFWLIAKGADINARDVNGWTPLITAAALGNLPLVKVLLESNADIEITTNSNPRLLPKPMTALELAQKYHQEEIVKKIQAFKHQMSVSSRVKPNSTP